MQDHNKARLAESIEELETALGLLDRAAGSWFAVGVAQAKVESAVRMLRRAAAAEGAEVDALNDARHGLG